MRSGDDRAFEALYARYHRRIAAYVYGMVNDHGRAEDITQEVFISALRRMRETDRPIAFKPWVYEIAKNACIDAFRRTRRTEEVSYDADDGLGGDHGRLVHTGPTPDVAVDQKLSLDHLCGAFGGLSEAHHEILVMRELEGLSYREIGERLGMSRPSVESTLFRARRRLTEEYEELISGERCTQIQSIIAGATGGRVGTRDERRMARHVSYCQPCRRQAFMAGFDVAALSTRPVRAKIAGLLPLPAFLKRRWSAASDDRPGAAAAHHSGTLAQLSTAAGQYADPVMGGWAKAAAAAATIALAGVGAGVATHGGALGIGGGSNAPATARPAATRPARAATPAMHAPRAGASVTATRSARSTSTTTHLPRSRSAAGSSPAASSSPSSSGTTTVGGSSAAGTTSTPAAAGGSATPILDAVQKTLTPARPPTGGGRPGPSASGSSPSVGVPTALTPLPKMAPLPDPVQTVTGAVDTATGSGGSGGGTLGGVTNTVGNVVGGG